MQSVPRSSYHARLDARPRRNRSSIRSRFETAFGARESAETIMVRMPAWALGGGRGSSRPFGISEH